ncbi:hypothetical protein PI95_030705 [Hassallia byssoidea VB512170]|uniref:Uncharacterized protein n=1 Tax=Hassallia byssoidea VB512170 TaxID=1304833 RepID=A0A846HI81_9CYAN|nr:hypothetical protein [Hassalia byssoidea VB512170]
MDSAHTITIYKALQKGKGQRLLKDGFQPADFPYSPPNADGKCYFVAPNSRSLAEEYNKYYKDGVLEVTIDRKIYDEYFKPLEKPYQGKLQLELPIPQSLFPVLNQFPTILKPE